MHDDGYFDEKVASKYDEFSASMFTPEKIDPVVDFLVDLAGNGTALELGIGTGRIALPLYERGVQVDGIEMSHAMVNRLRTKPDGDKIGVTIGDFSTVATGGRYSVAYLVFNTIMNLTSQESQVSCFKNVASHLEPGGCFVIEVSVPRLQELPQGQHLRPYLLNETRMSFDEYDVSQQGLTSHHFTLEDGNWEKLSIPFRYVWPAELDLMAQIAGLVPVARWSDWNREPFTNDSKSLIAVWQKPPVSSD